MTKHTVAQVEDMIATENDAVVSKMLRAYVTLLEEKADNGITNWNGTTHYAGCIQAGPKHYECALQEVGRLRGTIMDLRVKLEASKQEAEIHKLQAEKNYELGTEYFDLYTKAVRGQLKERTNDK
jgi:hypothetical protein